MIHNVAQAQEVILEAQLQLPCLYEECFSLNDRGLITTQ